MKFYKQLVSSINDRFTNAQVPGTAKRAPRPGYYFIKNVYFDKVEPMGEIAMALVNWKANLEDHFVADATFAIALTNLISSKAEETIDLLIPDLYNKVIYVFNPVFDTKFFNGEPKTVLICQWNFVDDYPKFITKENAALHAFFGNARNIQEAYKNLVSDSVYDVLEALDAETRKVTPNEELIESLENSLILTT